MVVQVLSGHSEADSEGGVVLVYESLEKQGWVVVVLSDHSRDWKEIGHSEWSCAVMGR